MKEQQQRHWEDSFIYMSWSVIRIGIPAALSIAIFEVQTLINMYFISNLGHKDHVLALGLGNLIMKILIFSVIKGIN